MAVAEAPVKLVPIRLDVELDGVKLRDQFTWNLNGVYYCYSTADPLRIY